jgi:hypothetical protein
MHEIEQLVEEVHHKEHDVHEMVQKLHEKLMPLTVH